MARDPENPFWTFSLAAYARPGVAPACLALQDRHGLDVNLLLFCCWAGRRGHALGEAELEHLIAVARPWQANVVRPLRQVRRWLKAEAGALEAPGEALRRAVKDQELRAERLEQQLLYQALALGDGPPAPSAAAGNLLGYLAAMEIRLAAADREGLAALLTGSFEDLEAEEALRLTRPCRA